MSTIELTKQELAIREQLIKAASEGKTLYYSDLVKEEDASLVHSLGDSIREDYPIRYREQATDLSIYYCTQIHRLT